MTGNEAAVDGQEMDGGRDLSEASHEELLIKAELWLLLC